MGVKLEKIETGMRFDEVVDVVGGPLTVTFHDSDIVMNAKKYSSVEKINRNLHHGELVYPPQLGYVWERPATVYSFHFEGDRVISFEISKFTPKPKHSKDWPWTILKKG